MAVVPAALRQDRARAAGPPRVAPAVRGVTIALALLFAGACTGGAPVGGPTPTTAPNPSADSTPTPSSAPAPTPTSSSARPGLATYGGQSVSWPRVLRTTSAPRALGAIETTTRVELVGGGTLAPGLTLPRLGGTAAEPLVLTPCAREVRLTGSGQHAIPASSGSDTLVVVDPGHGGDADGAVAMDGTREADVVLALAKDLTQDLHGVADRVVMTRTTDMAASLQFRVALADAMRADLAISVHLDANPLTTSSPIPGTQVYGALSDPHGRRAAGVIYQAERRYLDTLGARVGHRWGSRRNHGALYRQGSKGDYYFLLRQSHVPWIINEAMFLTVPREEALVTDPGVRRGLARALAGGIGSYLGRQDPGSGWRQPIPQPPDPAPPGGAGVCHDPA